MMRRLLPLVHILGASCLSASAHPVPAHPVPPDVASCRALPSVTRQFGQRFDGIMAAESYLLMRYGPVFSRDVLSTGARLVWKPLVPRAAVSTPLVVYTITHGAFGSVAIGCQTP